RLLTGLHGHHHAGALHRYGPGQDRLQLCIVLGHLPVAGTGGQRSQVPAQLGALVGELLVPVGHLAHQPDQVVLAQAGELVLLGLADLGDDAQPEQHTHQPDQQLCAHRAAPAGAPCRTGPAGRLAVLAGRAGALRVLGCLAGTAVLSRHALKTCRRMEEALEKIRMPSTTTTAVLSWDPTPSWSPRNTSRAAMTTLNRKEVTNTRSSKTPSRRARTAPNRASSAATTAIGR